MYFDLAALTVPFRILKLKLIFYHHVATLPKNSVANQMLVIQEKFKYPSLYDQLKPFFTRYGIVDIEGYSKKVWKQMVTQKISDKNREYLIEKAKSYKKLDHLELACEEYKQKDYFSSLNLSQARLKFQERALCVETCRTFFTSDQKNISASFKCFHCPKIDLISHWRTCPRYETLRTNRGLSLDED